MYLTNCGYVIYQTKLYIMEICNLQPCTFTYNSVHVIRFHAYAVVMEMDTYEGNILDKSQNHSNIILKRKTYGGVPPGSGSREDVIMLFEELEEARNTLAQIQVLMDDAPDPRSSIGPSFLIKFCNH